MGLLSFATGHLPRLVRRASQPVRTGRLPPLLSSSSLLRLRERVYAYHPVLPMPHATAHRTLGDQRSLFRGQGMDYEESRPYQPGDDIRFMDWRATARHNMPYIKVFREERRPGLFLLIDRRCSMRFGSRRRLKACQAVRAAALLAFAAQQRNEPVSGMILQHGPRWFWPGQDPMTADNLINTAAGSCPPCTAVEQEPVLPETLKLMQTMLLRGSRVYLISDFYDVDDQSRAILLQMASKHQLCACHIVDPAELALPAVGALQISNPGQAPLYINSEIASQRQAYTKQAGAFLETRKRLFTQLGLNYVRLMTPDEVIEPQLL